MKLLNPLYTKSEVTDLKEWLKYRLCPIDCKFLTPKEEEQLSNEQHFCTKHHVQLFHLSMHPRIIAVKNCEYLLNIIGENKCKKEKKPARWRTTVITLWTLVTKPVSSIIQKLRKTKKN